MIIPALDLINGNVVRLSQGDYSKQTNYNNNPLFYIDKYIRSGAKLIHLIDLSGAKNPLKRQIPLFTSLIKEISKSSLVQVGGGIRSIKDIKLLLNAGAYRVIIGSSAIKTPKEVKYWFKYFGSDKLVLALDIRKIPHKNNQIAINAWQDDSGITLEQMINNFKEVGLKHVLCTDILRDGTLSGIDIEFYKSMCLKWKNINFQSSGGISNLDDIKKLTLTGVTGMIIGRALLEKKFSLLEALKCLPKE